MRHSSKTMRRRRALLVFYGALASLLSGCARSEVNTELPPEQQNLRGIVMSYQQAVADLSRSPKNLDELRPYVEEYGDADSLLTSPGDSKLYVIVWDIDISKIRRGQMPIVAYERTGSDGQHRAIDYQLTIRSLNDQQVAAIAVSKR